MEGSGGVRAALRVLTHLAAQRGPVPAASVAGALGLPRSTVYRLLGVLAEHGYAVHYPELGRWGVGVAAFELGSGYTRQEPLTRLGAPVLAALVDEVGENGHLAVLDGRDVVYLAEERAPHRSPLVTDVGVRLPADRTASGRALLAALSAAQLRALFPDPGVRRAPGAVLGAVRARGWATEEGEVTPGLASVAVAVRDRAGWPAAALALTYERERVDPARESDLAGALRRGAAELARRIHAPLFTA